MNYNKALETRTLQFLRVRIGQQFTPEELWKGVSVLCAATEEEFKVVLNILTVEELIKMSSAEGDASNAIQKVTGITKEGLQLLRARKY